MLFRAPWQTFAILALAAFGLAVAVYFFGLEAEKEKQMARAFGQLVAVDLAEFDRHVHAAPYDEVNLKAKLTKRTSQRWSIPPGARVLIWSKPR